MEIAILSLIDKFYPVGSFFDTTNTSFDPNDEWGGTWERITDGSVLMSEGHYESGVLVTPGNGCGNSNPKIPLSAIPSHTHTYQKSNATSGSHTLTINEIPSHRHTTTSENAATLVGDLGNWQKLGSGSVNVGRSDLWNNTSYVGGGKGHTHPISFTSTNTGTSGSSNNFSVVQKSLVVCRWHRTA